MRILVDTSVWADFFNQHPSPQAEVLAEFIRREYELATCGVVLAEFFQGLRSEKEIARLLPYFREMTYLAPEEPETYLQAARLYRGLRAEGITVRSTIDCLVACLAGSSGSSILTRDRDFQLICGSGISPARLAPLDL